MSRFGVRKRDLVIFILSIALLTAAYIIELDWLQGGSEIIGAYMYELPQSPMTGI
jgi:hypothetical protein